MSDESPLTELIDKALATKDRSTFWWLSGMITCRLVEQGDPDGAADKLWEAAHRQPDADYVEAVHVLQSVRRKYEW